MSKNEQGLGKEIIEDFIENDPKQLMFFSIAKLIPGEIAFYNEQYEAIKKFVLKLPKSIARNFCKFVYRNLDKNTTPDFSGVPDGEMKEFKMSANDVRYNAIISRVAVPNAEGFNGTTIRRDAGLRIVLTKKIYEKGELTDGERPAKAKQKLLIYAGPARGEVFLKTVNFLENDGNAPIGEHGRLYKVTKTQQILKFINKDLYGNFYVVSPSIKTVLSYQNIGDESLKTQVSDKDYMLCAAKSINRGAKPLYFMRQHSVFVDSFKDQRQIGSEKEFEQMDMTSVWGEVLYSTGFSVNKSVEETNHVHTFKDDRSLDKIDWETARTKAPSEVKSVFEAK